MEHYLLLREKQQMLDCTLGVLYDPDSQAICCTLELPWLDNHAQTSCIPKGSYKVTRYNSPSKGEVFLLHDVPERSMVEIHAGNTVDDIKGCIAVGATYGRIKGKRAVVDSRKTMMMLREELPLEFVLDIE
jgi:hypothetical protein